MIASSAGSSPLSETAPDARAVTAAISGPPAQLDVRHGSRELVRDRRHRSLRAGQHAALPVHPGRGAGSRRTARGRGLRQRGRPARMHHAAAWAAVALPARLRRLADDHGSRHRVCRVAGAAGIWSRRRRIRAPDKHLGHDAHASLRTVRRSRRRGDDAQAVLETALVIPILLFLVCNFIAVMVQVTVQEQLNSATALAAQSRFQAPENAVDAAGSAAAAHTASRSSPPVCQPVAGMRQKRFYGTMTHVHRPAPLADGDALHVGRRQRQRGHSAGTACRVSRVTRNAEVSCDIGSLKAGSVVVPGYLDRTLNPPSGLDVVTCSASASLDFANTPLAWGVFWTPTCMRMPRRFRLRSGNDAARAQRVSHASPAWADTHRVRTRIRVVPVQSRVPRRGLLGISLRVVGARPGRRTVERAIGRRLGDPEVPVRRCRPCLRRSGARRADRRYQRAGSQGRAVRVPALMHRGWRPVGADPS